MKLCTPQCAVSIAVLFFAIPSRVFADPTSFDQVEEVIVWANEAVTEWQVEQSLTPGGVSLVDAKALSERNVSNLSDALRYVPGVWTTSTSGSDSIFFSSRGSNLDATNYDMNGLKLLQDGLSVTTADGNNHNRIIDPLAARQASFARGANALKYGASTLGGAINFVTPTARNSDTSQLFIGGGSHGQRQVRATRGAVFNDSLDALITLEHKLWQGYRDHNQSDRKGLYANMGWRMTDTIETRLFASYLDNKEELPGALTAAELSADPHQAAQSAIGGDFQKNVETQRLANKTIIRLDKHRRLEFGIYRETQTLFHPIVDKILVDFDGPGPAQPVEVFSLLINTDHQDIGAMVRYQHRVGDHQLLAGANWSQSEVTGGHYRNDGGRKNGLREVIDNSAHSLEIFMMDRWRVNEPLTLVYGIQSVTAGRDVRNINAANGLLRNPSDAYRNINPRLGAIYQLNADIEWFGNISALYEAPTHYELEDDIRANNKTLDAMQGTVLEVGSRGLYGVWRWDVSLYYASIQDEILSQDDPAAPGTSLSTNIDNTVHAGLEALISASFTWSSSARIEPLISVAVNEFSFDSDEIYGNNRLPAAPGYVVHGEVLYRQNTGFYAGPTFDVVDERYADFANQYTVDSYTLVGFRMGLNRDRWQVYLDARNLTGEDSVSTLGVVDTATTASRMFNAGEPRSVYAGISVRF